MADLAKRTVADQHRERVAPRACADAQPASDWSQSGRATQSASVKAYNRACAAAAPRLRARERFATESVSTVAPAAAAMAAVPSEEPLSTTITSNRSAASVWARRLS